MCLPYSPSPWITENKQNIEYLFYVIHLLAGEQSPATSSRRPPVFSWQFLSLINKLHHTWEEGLLNYQNMQKSLLKLP